MEPTKDPGLLSYKTNNNQKMEFHKLKVYGQDGNEIEILHDFADSVGTIYTLSEAVALDLRIVEDEQNYSLTEFHINKPIRLISGFESFRDCKELMTAGLSLLDTRDVTSMSDMFKNCQSLRSLDLTGWDTKNVADMVEMFSGCGSLSSLDLAGWNTKNVTNMTYMFYGCGSLSTLDLTGWDTKNVTDMTSMFYGCANLRTITMKGCDENTVQKIEDALTKSGIRDNVTIVRE